MRTAFSTGVHLFTLLLLLPLACARTTEEARLAPARRAIERFEMAKAREMLEREVTSHPRSARAHDLLGLSLRGLGLDPEAERAFAKAIRIDLDLPEPRDHLAALHYEQGRRDEALREWRETVRLAPAYVPARYNLGSALQVEGRLEESLPHFREAIRNQPDLVAARMNLGSALLALGRFVEAEKELRQAVDRDPQNPDLAFNLGAIYVSSRKIPEAIPQLERAVALRPGFAEAHERLATARYYEGKTDEALREFREALRLRPDLADAHFGIGVILTDQEDAEGAIRAYERALEIRPDHPDATTNLTALYGRKGIPIPRAVNRVAAFEIYRRALLRGDWRGAWNCLAPRTREMYLGDPQRFRYAAERSFSQPKMRELLAKPTLFLKFLEPPEPALAFGFPYDPTRLDAVKDEATGEWKIDFTVVTALPAPDLLR